MTESFKILSDRDHCLANPYMYIGSTSPEKKSMFVSGEWTDVEYVPGLIKIFNEILDNSVDEFIRTKGKHANIIDVTIYDNPLTDCNVVVSDNGRGIPIEKIDDGSDEGEWRPVVAWTRARAGSNFNDDRDTIGAHGLGSYLTNVFSTEFTAITTDSSKQCVTLKSHDNANSDYRVSVHKNSGETGTHVQFTPDKSVFDGLSIDSLDHRIVIRERLRNLAVSFPGIKFRLNGETIEFTSLKAFLSEFSDHCVHENNDGTLVAFAPAGEDQEFRTLSLVNGLHITSGGSHVDYIMDNLIQELRPRIKRKHKVDIKPNGIQQNLILINVIRGMKNLRFDSQTKERITNPKSDVQAHLGDIDFKRLATKILDTPEIIDPIVEASIQKKLLAERLAAARKQKRMKKKRIASHIEAMHSDPEKRTLMITEGLSAISSLIQFRDAKTIGGYPLKGKVRNVRGLTPNEMVENKEIAELLSILGLEVGKPAKNLNYGRIGIMTDADTDGASIACMLVNLFSCWPELFNDGRVHLVVTPLFIAEHRKTGEKRFYYNFEQYSSAGLDAKQWEVDYTKGLGSLPEDIYERMIESPYMVRIDAGERGEETLEMAFGDSSEARKEWILNKEMVASNE